LIGKGAGKYSVSANDQLNTYYMGKLAHIKTKETDSNVDDFINAVEDEQKRKDSFVILKMMRKATKEDPKMWGSSIIGFGNVRYKSPKTGREVDWFKIGFSPRKANITLYLNLDVRAQTSFLQRLGKHKTGVGCLYMNKLEDIDVKVLEEMINAAVAGK
jgi:hypothetical protein